MVSLAIFAWLLTLADVHAAGRAYAAYGGIYVAASVMWLWAVEGVSPRTAGIMIGACVVLIGAGIILFAPHGA